MGAKGASKVFAVLVAFVLVLGMIPAVAFAANTNVGTMAALNTALGAAQDGDTITLTANITSYAAMTYSGGHSVTIVTDGHTLTINNGGGAALTVSGAGSELLLDSSSGGAFNVIGLTYGVRAIDGGKAQVTGATSEGSGGVGAYAASGGSVEVVNITTDSSGSTGAYASGAGSSITVTGNITSLLNPAVTSTGVKVDNGGQATVDGTVSSRFPTEVSVGGSAASYEDPPSWNDYKSGYFTYTDGVSIAWIKGNGPAPAPEVLSVTVTPDPVKVEQGKTQQFTPTVTGNGAFSQDVTWSVAGSTNPGTTIDAATGLLKVAADETATTLTVTATSVTSVDKYGTATVTVTKAPEKEKKEEKKTTPTNETTTTPSAETTPTVSSHPITGLPKTGDATLSNMGLGLGITALTALGVLFVNAYRKRSNA
ncbi:MAG: Ig-like domain-containing protein [Coriobacteriia bacterium]|nr:Ig-like domain-containing protein [Coriobacteriia bacterium]